jgi:molecular chaperone DnaJ
MLRCSNANPFDVQLDDPYRELGLTPEASDADVKAAWRRLSARWHPDRNASPQALHKTQRINRALEEIRQARGRSDDGDDAAADRDTAPEEDAIEHPIKLSLEEAACGCERDVGGEVARTCAACSGSGVAHQPMACTQCGGEGRVRPSLWFAWPMPPVSCDACGGEGSIHLACGSCEGSGQLAPRRYRGRVQIPAGVRDGQVLQARVRLQGRDGPQLLNVRVSLRPHEFLALEADGTVRVEVPVDGFAWIAGRWIEVPTPYGLRQMRLQRGALTYRIRGEGFPAAPAGPRADCLVTVVPLFPEEWSTRQASMLDKLVAANTGDAASEAGARAKAWAKKVTAGWRGVRQVTEVPRCRRRSRPTVGLSRLTCSSACPWAGPR